MKKSLLFLVLIPFLGINQLYAQQPVDPEESDTLEIRRDKRQNVTFIRFKEKDDKNNRLLRQDQTILASVLILRKQIDDFRMIRENIDKLGFTHRKYQQYYNGTKVDNAQFITHGRSSVEVINGAFFV
jgi:Zn-dependent metalloprotease